MIINRKLNLVVPLDRDTGTVYVHSTPITKEAFERYFLVIGKTFAAIYNEGLGAAAGPRVAALLLLREAEKLGEDALRDVKNGLIAEIRRLTTFIMPTDKGWQPVPYQEATQKNLLDEDEVSEVDNALAFFTVMSAMHRKDQLTGILGVATQLWGAHVVSSSATEFATSLSTSTTDGSSGGKVTP